MVRHVYEALLIELGNTLVEDLTIGFADAALDPVRN